jgi:hypothetical protein
MQGGAPEVPDDIVGHVKEICERLPEITLRVDRWAYSFEIRKKPFCLLFAPDGPDGRPVPMAAVRADPDEREALLAIGHPFFAAASGVPRVGIVLGDHTDWTEITELVTESYRLLAPKKLSALLD